MRLGWWIGWAWLSLALAPAAWASEVRLKDLGRFLGWRDNALVGYGLVTGLAGSGDSPRSQVTRQALSNVLGRLGANIPPDQMQSRNVAAVMVMATLPPAANVGDRIDVTVSSIGDARSLAGGSLLMTPLLGPDRRSYALAQGALVVGGYRFDADYNLRQKNYPTSGVVPSGATVETAVTADLAGQSAGVHAGGGRGELLFILKDPDMTTAARTADAINAALGFGSATVRGADRIAISQGGSIEDAARLIARIEAVTLQPDQAARIVVNERTGTVVAGGGVRISSVVISQGDIKVSVEVDREASQPTLYGGYAGDVRSLIVANTRLSVAEAQPDAVVRLPDSTVGDLVQGLARARVGTRGMIAILQAMKTAGALHADIIVQ